MSINLHMYVNWNWDNKLNLSLKCLNRSFIVYQVKASFHSLFFGDKSFQPFTAKSTVECALKHVCGVATSTKLFCEAILLLSWRIKNNKDRRLSPVGSLVCQLLTTWFIKS